MDDSLMLMIPGPTPVPESVRLAMARHPIPHRSPEFNQLMADVVQHLQWLYQTESDVLILASSGTGAMEAGIINFLSPGDRVLVGNNGKFGQRWADLCRLYGFQVETVDADWGQPLDPEEFRQRLEADHTRSIQAVIITHSETSTGVLSDLEAINHHIKAHGQALIIVDAVTSLGATNLPMDQWGLDVVVSGSQKGLMVPPGLGFVGVSPKAWQAYETAKFPRYYLDLGRYRRDAVSHNTPFTPPVNLFFALQVALHQMRAEGLHAIFARHQRLMTATRSGLNALGLTLLAPDSAASPAITAVLADRFDAEQLRIQLKKRFKIAIAGGQDHLKGKILRIGHLGYVSDREILALIAAFEAILPDLGYDSFRLGAGVEAVTNAIAQF